MGRCTEGCCLLPAERLCTHGPSATGRSHSTHLNRNVYSLNLLSGPQSCPPPRGTLRARRKKLFLFQCCFSYYCGETCTWTLWEAKNGTFPCPPAPHSLPSWGPLSVRTFSAAQRQGAGLGPLRRWWGRTTTGAPGQGEVPEPRTRVTCPGECVPCTALGGRLESLSGPGPPSPVGWGRRWGNPRRPGQAQIVECQIYSLKNI